MQDEFEYTQILDLSEKTEEEPSSTPTFVIEVRSGPEDGKEWRFTKREIQLGRSSGNDVALTKDPFISRSHALLKHKEGRFWIKDLGSPSGVYVGAKQVMGVVLLEEDQLFRLGKTWLSLEEL